MSEQRPDPDQLLDQIRQDEERARRGRLRIYFGASAGVGKTYAMLAAAQRERKAGREVLVGLIETHGRGETAELLAGLTQLPLRQVAHEGRTLGEFDLDAALARHPDVLLVDELAHSNAAGSRHPKRWQDVQELLRAGIDVWTALNVQHLESLNGAVGAITGVRVHETVPDTVLDGADEVVLVDVTPDELLGRLNAGKVYMPEQAERAVRNFFRKGNLIALRELALRRTAEHVEDDVRSYRARQAAAPAWSTEGAILACVGPHEGAEQAVRGAARLAGRLSARWHAVYVETPRLRELPATRRDRVLSVLQLAEQLGAGTAVLTGDDVAGQLARYAAAQNCATLVLGRPASARHWPWWLLGRGALAHQLARLAPTLDLLEVGTSMAARRLGGVLPAGSAGISAASAASTTSAAGTAGEAGTAGAALYGARGALHEDAAPADSQEPWSSIWPRYVWAAGGAVLVTLLCTPLVGWLDLANIVMLFLLAVVLMAVKFGRGPAAFAAVLNVLAFDFFFVPPRFSFAVSDAQYIVTFLVMLGVGLLTGQLTAGLRFQARVTASREQRAQALFELTRDLSAALQTSQVVELGEAAVARSFGGQAHVLVTDLGGQLLWPDGLPADLDASIAEWALRNAQPAGLATSTLPGSAWHFEPLAAPMRVRGVLALRPARPRWLFIPEQVRQLQTLARQIAIALERVHYVEVAQDALVQMESERLRNALLAAISHDVRTPLTALIGLADSLSRSSPPLAGAQQETARALSAQAHQLNALVTNLLDMARLQHGAVSLRSEWQSVEEVVGASIRAARHALGGMAVKTQLPPDLPLVEFDAALMERVLVNLLENAAKYGQGPVELGARVTPGTLELVVRDHGPGLPESARGHEQQLFDKFTRGQAESATPGVGLGLAICQAVVEAHRGRISAANAAGGGAEFTITLPRREPPQAIDPTEP